MVDHLDPHFSFYFYPLDCSVNPLTCATSPADWLSAGLSNCDTYVDNQYCNNEGGYGPGWEPTFATFSIWATNGVTAVQACCGCGGGVAAEFLPADPNAQACMENVH